MDNFTYHNPVKIVFGRGTISELERLIPHDTRVMITYGGGSIKTNGVHDQALSALGRHSVVEFGGIEPNPEYETLMKAAALARKEDVGLILSVGGGSVLDGTKFIAAAATYEGNDPWDMVCKGAEVASALPVGAVLTLPATGSEMNGYAVISRRAISEKRAFGSPLLYPAFSILDPETTFSLPERQVKNGIVDTFVHVAEQYLTVREGSPLQDRQAEAVLSTLIEEGPKALVSPRDYAVRANLMWAATQALNGLIGCGVPQDWATHMIGHEITAFHGLDHGQTLAVVLPAVLRHQMKAKRRKLAQYAERVWGIGQGDDDAKAEAAIEETVRFFRSLGVATKLGDYGVGPENFEVIGRRFDERGMVLGEGGAIRGAGVVEILNLCL